MGREELKEGMEREGLGRINVKGRDNSIYNNK